MTDKQWKHYTLNNEKFRVIYAENSTNIIEAQEFSENLFATERNDADETLLAIINDFEHDADFSVVAAINKDENYFGGYIVKGWMDFDDLEGLESRIALHEEETGEPNVLGVIEEAEENGHRNASGDWIYEPVPFSSKGEIDHNQS
jgi:hypothetical protein